MTPDLQGIRIAAVGGDARSLFYIPALLEANATVKAVGFEKAVKLIPCENVDLAEALVWADVVILPMSGVGSDGTIAAQYAERRLVLGPENSVLIRPGTLVLSGVARPLLRQMAAERRWHLIEINAIDDLTILNSIPSAEGAIQMAMEASDITIHDSSSWVLGFGRVGITLACMLDGLRSRVTVAARGSADLARVKVFGYRAIPFSEIAYEIHDADFIFNTVPALVLPESLLQLTKPDLTIIDIASSPGGVDFAAAERLGRTAILAPSLPGKVAPRSAGRILGELLPRIIKQHLEGRNH